MGTERVDFLKPANDTAEIVAMPPYRLHDQTVPIGTTGECEVCGWREQVAVLAVGVPVGEFAACPACTRTGARWLREEVGYRHRPSGGAA